MDSINTSILEILKTNSRSTASDISKKVNLSIPAVAERIRKFELLQIIKKYTIILNKDLLGMNLTAFIFVDIDKTIYVENFRKEIVKYDCVLECHHIAGQNDYLLKTLFSGTQGLELFLTNDLKKIPGVIASNTIICLSTLKEEINL